MIATTQQGEIASVTRCSAAAAAAAAATRMILPRRYQAVLLLALAVGTVTKLLLIRSFDPSAFLPSVSFSTIMMTTAVGDSTKYIFDPIRVLECGVHGHFSFPFINDSRGWRDNGNNSTAFQYDSYCPPSANDDNRTIGTTGPQNSSQMPYMFDYMGSLQEYYKEHKASPTSVVPTGDWFKPLQDRHILFMGDSNDRFVAEFMCQCFVKSRPVHKWWNRTNALRTCYGNHVESKCTWNAFNLTISYHGTEYGVHPYGIIPHDRGGPNRTCLDAVPLKDCLRQIWRHSLTMGAQAWKPDIVTVNINYWFWHRIGRSGTDKEKRFYNKRRVDKEDELMQYYRQNLTDLIEAGQEFYARGVPPIQQSATTAGGKHPILWAIHTAVLSQSHRFFTESVSFANRAMKKVSQGFSSSMNAGRYQAVGVLDWEYMARGWPPELILQKDGVHPQTVFFVAVANIYLNALGHVDHHHNHRET